MLGKIVLGLGILGIFVGGLTLIISMVLPQMTSAVSWNEAMLGIIPGAIVLVLGFLIAVVGLVIVIIGRKKAPTGS